MGVEQLTDRFDGPGALDRCGGRGLARIEQDEQVVAACGGVDADEPFILDEPVGSEGAEGAAALPALDQGAPGGAGGDRLEQRPARSMPIHGDEDSASLSVAAMLCAPVSSRRFVSSVTP
jgi:hypothetical protein